jgi:GNAT superfamily N-acetyltransferase
MEGLEQQLGAAAGSGEPVWVTVRGRSLAPVCVPGDRAAFAPCSLEELGRGALVLIRSADEWVVRLVVGTSPLRTASFMEDVRAERGEVRARLVMLERRGRRRRWGWVSATHALLRWRLRGGLRTRLLQLRPVRALRAAWLGRVCARVLTPADAPALDRFAARHLGSLRQHVVAQCGTRWPGHGFGVGLFDRRGRIVGFGYVDEYRAEGVDLPGYWMRSLVIVPIARGLGLGAALWRAQLDEARARGIPELYADVRATNTVSLRLMERFGFGPAPTELSRRANALTRPPGEPPRLVLEKVFEPT